MASPWPSVEQYRNKMLRGKGRVFGFYACVDCTRWFPNERAEDATEPTKCPLHDDAEQERRKQAGERLQKGRKRDE